MSTEIESLELKIESDSTKAAKGIDALTQSLTKLKNATKNGLGLTAVSKEMEKINNATKKVRDSNNKTSTSFTDLYHKLKMVGNGFKAFGKSIYSAIGKSSDYVENVNLFTVAMGDYADEAQEYAETVGEAMGIDPGEWMRNQGVFMTLATGFGVASDRAAVMSKNLTQLGYDLSSFFNISYEDAMQKLQSGLSGELEPLRRIGYDLSQAKLEATALELGIDKAVSSMTQAEKAQLRYYAIMTQVTTAHGDMARTLEAPANQLKVFKAQVNMASREIGNVFIPILNAILPYAIAVTKVIRTLASSIASIVGFEMPEVDYSGVESMSGVAEDTSSALDDATDSAKKLKSYMLGFDELNVINPDSSGSIDGISGITDGLDFKLPEYNFLEGLAESRVAEIVEGMKEWLGITEDIDSWGELFETRLGKILIAAGLVAVALGTWKIVDGVTNALYMISNLSKVGSFSLGLSLAVIGITIGALAIENALTEGLNGTNIAALLAASASIIAGGALIGKTFGGTLIGAAVGAIIAGLAGLGIGLHDAIANELNIANGLTIALSAALVGLGVTALLPTVATGMGAIMGAIIGAATVGAIWIIQNTEDTVTKVGAIIAGAALAVGAILAFTGVNVPLGIGLMAAGAVTMGTAIALNTNALSDEVKGVIAIIAAAVSVALLAVGAVLAFTGINIPLGIALMAGGALTMGTAIVPNWNELSDSVQNVISIIMAAVGGAALVVGAILAFTGANIPLGIGLMLVGAASLGTAIALNWESISEALTGPVGTITALISGAVLALGAILAFTGVGIPIGIALMLVGAAGLATVTALNWDTITEALSGPVGGVTAIISGALLALGAILAFTGVGIPIGIALMLLGAAGLATVTALNWDSITDALSGPVGAITAIISGALLAIGAILCFTGVGIPLGIALIAAGAAGLATVIALNWNSIQVTINRVIQNILKVVSGAMLVMGVLLCLSGAGIGLGLALIFGALKVSNTAWGTDDNPITNFVKKMVNGIVNMINKVIDAINEMFHIEFGGLELGGVQIIPSFDKRLINIPKIPLMAEGGFPEEGQMFIAREAGAEMVGNIGRRTAVANNDQIVASISGGVAEANEEQNALLREQNSLLRAILEKDSGVYLDGKNLTNSVEKYQRERGRVLITGGVM